VGLAESKWQPTARFMALVTRELTAEDRDQLRNPRLESNMGLLYLWIFETFLLSDGVK